MGYTLPDRKAKDWDLSLQTVFDQVFADYQSAGTGTAKMRIGTAVERAAYSTPYDGLMWSETDTGLIYQYYSSAWHQIGLPVAGAANAGMGAVVKSDGSGWEPGAPPPIMLPLALWQTLSTEKTVEAQDAEDTDGHGADLAYHFVFPDAQDSAMYIVVPVDFGGFDLRLVVPYRMSAAASGDVYWMLAYIAVTPGDTQAELADYAAWVAAGANVSLAHTPSASANVLSEIDSASFHIPNAAYAAGDYLHIMLMRNGDHASDTRTGNAEPLDAIRLKPVVP